MAIVERMWHCLWRACVLRDDICVSAYSPCIHIPAHAHTQQAMFAYLHTIHAHTHRLYTYIYILYMLTRTPVQAHTQMIYVYLHTLHAHTQMTYVYLHTAHAHTCTHT